MFIFAQIAPPPPVPAQYLNVNVTPKQQEILNRIYNAPDNVVNKRMFGACSYDWSNWKMINGLRVTNRSCDGMTQEPIYVSCEVLKTNTLVKDKWQGWISPASKQARKGEDLMVATLCANVVTQQKEVK